MEKEIKYTIVTVRDFPRGFQINYFYLQKKDYRIGDVLISKTGKQYQIIDGITSLSFAEIDFTKYHPFE